jgi:hypothetical protein
LRLLDEHRVLTAEQVHRLMFTALRTCQVRAAHNRNEPRQRLPAGAGRLARHEPVRSGHGCDRRLHLVDLGELLRPGDRRQPNARHGQLHLDRGGRDHPWTTP